MRAPCTVPRRDRNGNAAGRVILLRDMTREREAERRYGELFHSLQEAVYVTCRDGRFLDANEAMARLVGVDSVEELLHPINTFLVPVFFVLMGIRVDLSTFGKALGNGFAVVTNLVPHFLRPGIRRCARPGP